MNIFFYLVVFCGLAMVTPSASVAQQVLQLPASWNIISDAEPDDVAETMVNKIMDVIDLKPNFILQAAKIDNAAATIYRGKKYILYNPEFIKKISESTQTDWAGVFILAHEIGHHLNGHTHGSHDNTNHNMELEADEFAGFVLRKLGASLAETQIAIKLISGTRDSKTHPGKNKRLAALEKGWNNASDQITGKIQPRLSFYFTTSNLIE